LGNTREGCKEEEGGKRKREGELKLWSGFVGDG
jgi:hypothetical protein